MARPRKATARTLRLEVRLTIEDDARITAGAVTLGITKSEYLRRMGIAGHIVKVQQSGYSMALAYELRRIGVNLNQLARVANSTGEVRPDLEQLCARMQIILDRVVEL